MSVVIRVEGSREEGRWGCGEQEGAERGHDCAMAETRIFG